MEDASDDGAEVKQHDGLSDLSLEEIQALRNKLGLKRFNKKFSTKKSPNEQPIPPKKKRIKNSTPLEMSSKKPDNPSRLSSIPKSSVTRDPRFDDLSGTFDDQLFKRSYKFVDRMKAKEAKAVRKIAEDEELDDQTRKRAKDMLTRMGQRKAAKKESFIENKVENTLKEERKQAMKDGHKPFFLKASEKNKLVLAEKYKELKEKGQLDSYMKKKRKQNTKKGSVMPERTTR